MGVHRTGASVMDQHAGPELAAMEGDMKPPSGMEACTSWTQNDFSVAFSLWRLWSKEVTPCMTASPALNCYEPKPASGCFRDPAGVAYDWLGVDSCGPPVPRHRPL
jgi:hypothetical protein